MAGILSIVVFFGIIIVVTGMAEQRLRRLVERRYGVTIQVGYKNNWTFIGEVTRRQRFMIHTIHIVGMILAMLISAAIGFVAITLVAQVAE